MRHCPECRNVYPAPRDICPECWSRLVPGPPPRQPSLALVHEAGAFFEADLVETLLREEGIPCLRLPARGALPSALAGLAALAGVRIYVRAEEAPAARELVAEVMGRRETEA